jgi:hypothetical protein
MYSIGGHESSPTFIYLSEVKTKKIDFSNNNNTKYRENVYCSKSNNSLKGEKNPSNQCCGSGIFILDLDFPSQISGSAILNLQKNLSILIAKNFSHSGSGSRGQKTAGFRIWIRNPVENTKISTF